MKPLLAVVFAAAAIAAPSFAVAQQKGKTAQVAPLAVYDVTGKFVGNYLGNAHVSIAADGERFEAFLIDYAPDEWVIEIYFSLSDCTGQALLSSTGVRYSIPYKNGWISTNGIMAFQSGAQKQATLGSFQRLLGNGTLAECNPADFGGTVFDMYDAKIISIGTPPFSVK